MAICVEHDIIVIEDGPYDMLTMGTFDPSAPAVEPTPTEPSAARRESFLKDLAPSYLSLDTTGRVLRIDSFSKVFFPAARVGWITGHKVFCERLVRHTETSTRMPAGLSQAVLNATLVGSKEAPGWGLTGWFDWLADLRDLYTARRNVLLGALHALAAHPHGKGRLSWVDPTCGMFIVLYVDLESTPRFKAGKATVAELLQELFQRCIDGPKGDGKNGVLVAPGDLFSVTDADKNKANFVRLTFAYAGNDEMRTAVERFGVALEALWTA
jgi:DNA-binding transcriptional MocR family regulator